MSKFQFNLFIELYTLIMVLNSMLRFYLRLLVALEKYPITTANNKINKKMEQARTLLAK